MSVPLFERDHYGAILVNDHLSLVTTKSLHFIFGWSLMAAGSTVFVFVIHLPGQFQVESY